MGLKYTPFLVISFLGGGLTRSFFNVPINLTSAILGMSLGIFFIVYFFTKAQIAPSSTSDVGSQKTSDVFPKTDFSSGIKEELEKALNPAPTTPANGQATKYAGKSDPYREPID